MTEIQAPTSIEPATAARIARELPGDERERLIREAGEKVVDLRPRLSAGAGSDAPIFPGGYVA